MNPVQHFFDAPTPGGQTTHRMAYLEWGGPNNPHVAVCVHGLTRNSRDFDFLAAELAKTHRVICPDIAGRGNSEYLANSDHYTYPAYAADMAALLGHLHIMHCDWVGTSMGGIIGMIVAAFHPHLIQRLVINDIGAVVAKEGLQRIVSYAGAKNTFASREEGSKLLREVFAPFGITNEAHWQHMMRHTLVAQPDGTFALAYDPHILDPWRKESKNFMQINDIDLSQLWNAVKCPVLIIRGAESDILRREIALSMCNSRAGISLLEIQGVGHAPSLMEAEQIQAIQTWIATTLPYRPSERWFSKLRKWLKDKFA